jgi:heterotetrameric sarcosine oxidase delta subunit
VVRQARIERAEPCAPLRRLVAVSFAGHAPPEARRCARTIEMLLNSLLPAPPMIAPFRIDRFRDDRHPRPQFRGHPSMGFKLNCLHCGPRSYHEFWFGGALRSHDPNLSEAEEYRDAWLRTNATVPQIERWFHYAGCRRWMTVERDTRDNSFGVSPFRETADAE